MKRRIALFQTQDMRYVTSDAKPLEETGKSLKP